jgi:hypothetical protein
VNQKKLFVVIVPRIIRQKIVQKRKLIVLFHAALTALRASIGMKETHTRHLIGHVQLMLLNSSISAKLSITTVQKTCKQWSEILSGGDSWLLLECEISQ